MSSFECRCLVPVDEKGSDDTAPRMASEGLFFSCKCCIFLQNAFSLGWKLDQCVQSLKGDEELTS